MVTPHRERHARCDAGDLVLQELKRQASWRDEPLSFFHFRDRDNFEVDIVIERGAGAVAGVEVKTAATVMERDFRGLRKLEMRQVTVSRTVSVLYDGDACIHFGAGFHAVRAHFGRWCDRRTQGIGG